MKLKKLKTTLLLLVSIMSVLPSPIVRASECTEVVKACDKALADQDKVIDLKTRQIEVQKEIISAQDKRIVELEKGNNIFSSPWFYLTVGLVVGGFLVGRVK